LVAISTTAVVVMQVVGLRDELSSVQQKPPRRALATTQRAGAAPGPGFHLDEPEHAFELAPPALVVDVDPVWPAPASSTSESVTDLISLA